MANNRDRVQMAIWACLVVSLIAAFLWSWRKMERPVEDVAYIVAGKRILEQANAFHQDWLLMKRPETLTINDNKLVMSDKGWVMPIDENGYNNCNYWWSVLYPKGEVFNGQLERIEMIEDKENLSCYFYYLTEHEIVIHMVDGRIKIDVGLTKI
ncbi:MSHA biogenesis protein MshF [Vibrio astriarenae]|nr:MSHA biogenesis protein MshF [Vibrio sp. C7]